MGKSIKITVYNFSTITLDTLDYRYNLMLNSYFIDYASFIFYFLTVGI